jgi:predicted transglutaminase-like cysteine proteinase
MISLVRIVFRLGIVLFSASAVFGQGTFFQVSSTPYDRQMARIQPTLTASSGYTIEGLSFALVNEWMIELRAMPYQYSREWRTPLEVEMAKVGDCKGKALALYDRMQLNGARNLRFVIGKRRTNDPLTHAWLEWETASGTLLLDPTFNWALTFKTQDPRNYVALYEYEGGRKYQAADSLLASRILGTRSPAAPAHGAITRPLRSTWRYRSNPWLFDEGTVDPRFFLNRAVL